MIGLLAFIGGAVVALVDGRKGLVVAVTIASLSLLLPVFEIAALNGASLILVAGAVAVLFWYVSRAAARHWPQMGPDPTVSLDASTTSLFGPRSVRATSAVVSLIAASWISLNIPVSGSGYGSGVLFAVAYIAIVSGFRLLLAHSIEDLAIGSAGVSLSAAAAVLLEGGVTATTAAGSVACLAVVAAMVVGWLSGRSDRSDSRQGRNHDSSGEAMS